MEREEQGSQVERKDQWEEMEWFAPYDEAQDRDQGVEEDEEPPTPSPIYDAPPSLPLPYLAICPAKPPSPATTTRGSSVETVVEDTQEAAFGSLQPRDEDEDDESADYSILDPSEPQTYTATELMLSLQHGTSFTSINTQETSASSRSNSTRSSLLPHKHDSPFSANHPLTTTLAPATSVSSLSLPAVLEPLPLQLPSSQTSSSQQSNSQSNSFPISSQASFSALPPPPPLPFSDQPISSQQERQQRLEEKNRKRNLKSSPQSIEEKRKRQKKGYDSTEVSSPLQQPPRHSIVTDTTSASPSRLRRNGFNVNSSSSPPPFPFSATQSSTNSTSQPDFTFGSSSQTQHTEVGGGEEESQETVEAESQEFESQETQGSVETTLEESQESVDY